MWTYLVCHGKSIRQYLERKMADGMIHILHDYWLGLYKEGVGKDTVEDWADPTMEVCVVLRWLAKLVRIVGSSGRNCGK